MLRWHPCRVRSHRLSGRSHRSALSGAPGPAGSIFQVRRPISCKPVRRWSASCARKGAGAKAERASLLVPNCNNARRNVQVRIARGLTGKLGRRA